MADSLQAVKVRPRIRTRGGFLLPLAILGLLALTALTMVTFTLVIGLMRDTTLERRYLTGWAGAIAFDSIPIRGGFEVMRSDWDDVENGGVGSGPRFGYHVERALDPFADSRRWTAVVFAPALWSGSSSGSPGDFRVQWVGPPCGSGTTDHSPASGPLLHFFDPLVELASPGPLIWESRIEFSGITATGPNLLWFPGPDGVGWLFSEGDVLLTGGGSGRGVLLANGRVDLSDGVEWEGGIAASGPVQVQDGALAIGDWCAIEAAIEILDPPRRLRLRPVGSLGRF